MTREITVTKKITGLQNGKEIEFKVGDILTGFIAFDQYFHCYFVNNENVTLILLQKTDILTYKEKQADEYPPLEELAEAIYWQVKGDLSMMNNYISKVEAVKLKYPGP